MSYILEALKKAQAERQLGDLPTIHAPRLDSVAGPAVGAAWRRPLMLGAGGLLILALGLAYWWSSRPPAPAAAPSPAAFASAPAPAPAPAATAAPATVAPPPLHLQNTPLPALAAKNVAPSPAPIAPTVPTAPTVPPVVASTPAPKPALPAAAPALAENLPSQRELPEPVQRQIPAVTLGGYIYSSNPEDRLLLIDKVLRHEGEEIAPGLTLEKLQPKAAVFNYRGYRYRVPY